MCTVSVLYFQLENNVHNNSNTAIDRRHDPLCKKLCKTLDLDNLSLNLVFLYKLLIQNLNNE